MRPVVAVALDERRQLVPPVRDEPAVAPGRPAAADVRLEQDDPRAGLQLGQPERRPQAGVAAADDDDVGRGRATQRRRGRGQVRRRGRFRGERLAQPPRPSRRRSAGRHPAWPVSRWRRQQRRSSSTSSTVTGFGTSRARQVRRSTPPSRPARSPRGRSASWAGRPSTRRSSRRGWRPASSRAVRQLGHGRDRRLEPDLRVRRRSRSIARSVAATNAAIASRFASSVDVADDEPVAGQRHDVVDVQDVTRPRRSARAGPARCWRSRSRHRPRPALTAAPWPKSGYSTISRSSGVRPAESSSAWSMIHDEP